MLDSLPEPPELSTGAVNLHTLGIDTLCVYRGRFVRVYNIQPTRDGRIGLVVFYCDPNDVIDLDEPDFIVHPHELEPV